MEIDTVTSSYSRKLSHGLYGGGNYETSDHFVSMTATLENNEDPVKAEAELHEACVQMVNDHVFDEIASFAGGINADEYYNYIRDMVARRPIDGETYQKANPRQKAVLQAIKRGLQMNKRDNDK